MNRREFIEVTPREFDLMVQGRERIMKEKQEEAIEKWRVARYLAYTNLQPHLKQEHQSLTIYDFLPLPGDPTPDEILLLREQADKESETRGMDMAKAVFNRYRTMKAAKEIPIHETLKIENMS